MPLATNYSQVQASLVKNFLKSAMKFGCLEVSFGNKSTLMIGLKQEV
ncbi:hypothetical protein ACFSJM_07910 [Lactococcus formosensis subsp. bovis]|nr:hypothetical protein [Lactococcus formosensis]